MPSFYEFFAGGGMARAGLGANWECLFANDIDRKKGASYAANWGSERLYVEDIRSLSVRQLPGGADLAWASFPCQDLSLAGTGHGLNGSRSRALWSFLDLVDELTGEQRSPSVIVLENVCGILSSSHSNDFAAICDAFVGLGYGLGAVVINASYFVPQSRPRLFLIALRENLTPPGCLTSGGATSLWHPPPLLSAYLKLSKRATESWIWWKLPMPPGATATVAALLEDDPPDVRWKSDVECARLLSLMSPSNRLKVERAQRSGRRTVGSVYRRTRVSKNGQRLQRAEVRFDDIAGCLRTPAGGSSRQTILIVEPDAIRCRLLSAREAARLMGLPDHYILPENYNDAYHLVGDGVVVPVVRFLAAHLLEPLLAPSSPQGSGPPQ